MDDYPKEKILPDNYPVHYGYLYVCDGKVRQSDLGGGQEVRHLKHLLGATEIKNCDIQGRNLWHLV